jgi:hypothetical protein
VASDSETHLMPKIPAHASSRQKTAFKKIIQNSPNRLVEMDVDR